MTLLSCTGHSCRTLPNRISRAGNINGDNLILKTNLSDISIGCSDSPQSKIGASNQNVSEISFQDQVVYQVNLHLMSTQATEKPKSLYRVLCIHVYHTLITLYYCRALLAHSMTDNY